MLLFVFHINYKVLFMEIYLPTWRMMIEPEVNIFPQLSPLDFSFLLVGLHSRRTFILENQG